MKSSSKASIAAVTALAGMLVVAQAPALAHRGDHGPKKQKPPVCAPVGASDKIVQIKGRHGGGRPGESRQKGTIVLNFKKGLTAEELTADLTSQIYHALSEGRINQSRADELVAGLPALIADFLSRATHSDGCGTTTTTTIPETTIPESTVPETTAPDTTLAP